MLETNTERHVFTVTELNQTIREILETAFPSIWIEGEISNFVCPTSGHWYFSLKDKNAQIRCAMFQGKNRGIGFQPSNGAHVLLRGKISLYAPRGEYQFIADWIEEAGDGALRRAFELLKAKLSAEGLFDPAHKKPLPEFPKSVGVITSPTGAAIRDILSVLNRRFPGLPIIVYPTAVQGDAAAKQIVHAIEIANQRKECDVLIVGRGGGSLEDLWSFNEEIVARAIYASELPIVSAVGHEIDFTIADFVADLRAATPSAAAELISPDKTEWLHRIEKLTAQLNRHLQYTLQYLQHALQNLMKRLRHPGQRLQEQMQRLDELEQRLLNGLKNSLTRKRSQLTELNRALQVTSPLATLDRGYAIVSLKNSGEIIRNANTVPLHAKIETRLSEGKLVSEVEEIY